MVYPFHTRIADFFGGVGVAVNQERRNQIAELVAQKHTIKNAELMERFGISIETVRRDLEYLEQQGCLQRVYGGAVLKTSLGSEPEYNSRAKDHAEEKSSIAMAAARLVEPGDSIFLGVGTTVQAMAQYLKNIPDLTAFTNSLRTAVALSELAECSVVLTGGQLRSKELSLSGFPAEENMLHFNVNKAFLGIGGITEAGVTDFHIGEDSVVTIDAGCGIHSEQGMSRHSGKHRFFIGKNSHVTYLEKHVGLGKEGAKRVMDPYSEIHLEEGSTLDMEVSQIGGLEESHRITKAFLDKDSTLKVKESLLTEKRQIATTDFHVELNGDSSNADIVSRSVAKDESKQEYTSRIVGNARCTGHSECDAIITGKGKVYASPALDAVNEGRADNEAENARIK